MTCLVTVQSRLCGALTFSSLLNFSASKNQSCQGIRIRPAVHSVKVFQLSSDVNSHPILQ